MYLKCWKKYYAHKFSSLFIFWYSSKFKGGIPLSVKGCELRMQWNSPLAVNTMKVFFYSLKTESSSNRKFRIKSLFLPNILFCKLPITAICLWFWTSLKYFTTTQPPAGERVLYQKYLFLKLLKYVDDVTLSIYKSQFFLSV